MGEGPIILFILSPSFGLGIGYRRQSKEISIQIPFFFINIELKRKTSQNNWFGFANYL